MVRLAENAGYGFDKIDSNWKEYNGSEPVYEISFDATILKLYIDPQNKNNLASEKLRDNFGETSEKLRDLINKNDVDNELISEYLKDVYEPFLLYLNQHFGIASEKLRNNFGITSETVRRQFGEPSENQKSTQERIFILLLLIAVDQTLTAEKAAPFVGVSTRTIEVYLSKLKEAQIIDRIGSRKEGRWIIKKD